MIRARMVACREVFGMTERRVRILASLRLETGGFRDVVRTVRDIDRTETDTGAITAA